MLNGRGLLHSLLAARSKTCTSCFSLVEARPNCRQQSQAIKGLHQIFALYSAKLAAKYYAVRLGRSKGIYRTWEECARQVHGYSGAVFKSFSTLTEAQQFIGGRLRSGRRQQSSSPAAAPAPVESQQTASNRSDPPASGLYRLEFDGASRGNPGRAGAGAVLYEHTGAEVGRLCVDLGIATNNVAEYSALVKGLQAAHQFGVQRLEVAGDSELVVKQLNRVYQCRHEGLMPLYQQARSLSLLFSNITFSHIARHFNTVADQLSNEAIDTGGWAGLRRQDGGNVEHEQPLKKRRKFVA